MTPPKALSINNITKANKIDAISTIDVLLLNSSHEGQVTLLINSSVVAFQISTILLIIMSYCTGGEIRTPDTWFWRPVLWPAELHPFVPYYL